MSDDELAIVVFLRLAAAYWQPEHARHVHALDRGKFTNM